MCASFHSSCWCKDLLSPTYLLWMIIINCVCVSLSFCPGRTTTMNTLRRNRGESLSMMMFPSAVMTRVWLSTETRLTPTLTRMDPLLASTRTAGDPRARLGPPSQPFRERTPPPPPPPPLYTISLSFNHLEKYPSTPLPPHLCIPSVYHKKKTFIWSMENTFFFFFFFFKDLLFVILKDLFFCKQF